ncbi:LacI family DNA-binding transcriptional regulator [Pelagovum pacificum]|uniref:LacI family transcriptional regulator n=1 Tax=Pelagovum pacificum TaxID=2588711 RepID=A0A5C5GAD3_9RHOB|nr:LacI family DNA-binding transcriptional regulator [Pelagovum pacificum]QQA41719.1 LacI family DNA-binding transcriptional regulator [Pelagovum pacificum]TNY30995.1 LacI family transcriptional regulator [Pelagovum pacificum]
MQDQGGSGRATIRDVANAVGVSTATVSKVMNATGRVSAETRKAVLEAARELDFRPNAMARALQSNRSSSVGLLTDDTYGRFSLPLMAGLTEGLIAQGMSVFLCVIDGPKELGATHLDALLQKRVDGLIISGRRVDRLPDIDLTGVTVPTVYALSHGPADGVTLAPDERHGAALAVSHLIEIGRRRIAHVTGPRRFRVAMERAESWRDTLAAEGLWKEGEALHGDWSQGWGHTAAAHLIDGRPASDWPDAVFCGSDQIGLGMIDAFRERGIDVPGQIAVIGFDNWQVLAAQARPPLSSIDMNLPELGREVGRTLTRMIAGESPATGTTRLPCTLVPRASTIGPAG